MGGTCRDVADEALLPVLWPFPQNKWSVVWYHHWLVCLAGVCLAFLETCSRRRGECSSSEGSFTFVREPFGASSRVFWAVVWAMRLFLLMNFFRSVFSEFVVVGWKDWIICISFLKDVNTKLYWSFCITLIRCNQTKLIDCNWNGKTLRSKTYINLFGMIMFV